MVGEWFKMAAWVSSAGAGRAGAATAGACVLCAAGTYQPGSGPPWQRRAEQLAGLDSDDVDGTPLLTRDGAMSIS